MISLATLQFPPPKTLYLIAEFFKMNKYPKFRSFEVNWHIEKLIPIPLLSLVNEKFRNNQQMPLSLIDNIGATINFNYPSSPFPSKKQREKKENYRRQGRSESFLKPLSQTRSA